MSELRPRPRPGHDLQPGDRLRPRRPRGARRRSRSSRRSSRSPGHVEHDPEAIWSSQLAVAREALAEAGARRRRHRRHRHHQPARDDDPLGPRTPASRSPTPSSGRAASARRICERAEGRRATRTLFRAQDRAGRRRLLLRHEDQAPARHRPRPARARRAGEILFGTVDTFLIWRLTGGQRARHRRQQRQPHAAVQHPHARVGRRAAAASSACRGAMLPEVRAVERGLRRDRRRRCSARPIPHRRRRGRPAGGDLRPGLLRAGQRQEHLRHRLLHAAEHRRARRCRRRTAC